MKSKPNISSFTTPKDVSTFLEGGNADKAERKATTSSHQEVPQAPVRGRGRIQKIFNFPEDLANHLRDEAAERTRITGTRVTEKDIVLAALETFLSHRL